jgi:flavin reductase (DIM6/NTAB) family NADH-FMN oxidoreductase RutF
MPTLPSQSSPGNVGPILSQLSAPLVAVSVRSGDKVNAQIAVTVSSASIVLHKPRVIVQIYHTNYTHQLIAESGIMALNFLSPDQLPLIWELGMRSGRDVDKLAAVSYANGATGCPILSGGFGFLDCQVINAMDGGDMTAFLAEVVAGDTRGDQPMRWREARPRLPQRWADEWDRKIAGESVVSEQLMLHPDPGAWSKPPESWRRDNDV